MKLSVKVHHLAMEGHCIVRITSVFLEASQILYTVHFHRAEFAC